MLTVNLQTKVMIVNAYRCSCCTVSVVFSSVFTLDLLRLLGVASSAVVSDILQASDAVTTTVTTTTTTTTTDTDAVSTTTTTTVIVIFCFCLTIQFFLSYARLYFVSKSEILDFLRHKFLCLCQHSGWSHYAFCLFLSLSV